MASSSAQAENRSGYASGSAAAALAAATASAAGSHMQSYNCLASVWDDSYENIPR
jgi:hypothetical protein